ncbi:MAG: hypothetical protein IH881_07010 [Myxococcales bacterium]|nr:hypothetical protein [Myxococcales bacterium]
MSNPFTNRQFPAWIIIALVCCAGLLHPSLGLARGELKDPTRPPDSSKLEEAGVDVSASSPYALTAILVAKGRRIAVINGQPVQAGDQVANATVVSIFRDKVVLRARTGDLTLRLLPRSIKISEASGK